MDRLPPKQIVRVLSAVELGCTSSNQIAAVTGLSTAACSHYLGELEKAGLVRVVKRFAVRFAKHGGASHVYAPALAHIRSAGCAT